MIRSKSARLFYRTSCSMLKWLKGFGVINSTLFSNSKTFVAESSVLSQFPAQKISILYKTKAKSKPLGRISVKLSKIVSFTQNGRRNKVLLLINWPCLHAIRDFPQDEKLSTFFAKACRCIILLLFMNFNQFVL